jgi:HSP20 family protein
MRRQTELKVLPLEETRKTSGRRVPGALETTAAASFERSVLSTLNEMEKKFEEAIHRPFLRFNMQPFRHIFHGLGSFGEFSPAVDIFEDANGIVVKSELPGMKKEDIKVELLGNTLCISGEKKSEEKVGRRGFYRLERSYGSFKRNLSMPEGIDYGNAKADFKNGILEIRIPKTDKKSLVQHIPIG